MPMRGSSRALGLASSTVWHSASDAGPIHRLARLRPRQADRKADEVDARVGGQLDLLLERTRAVRPGTRTAGRAGRRRSSGPGPARPGPQAHPVTVPLARAPGWRDGRCGNRASGRPAGPSALTCSAAGLSRPRLVSTRTRAHRILRPRRPERPAPVKAAIPALELLGRDHVVAGVESPHVEVVEVDFAGRCRRSGSASSPCRRRPRRRELEARALRPPGRSTTAGCPGAKEHPRPHRLAIDDDPRCARRSVDPHRLGGRCAAMQDTSSRAQTNQTEFVRFMVAASRRSRVGRAERVPPRCASQVMVRSDSLRSVPIPDFYFTRR